MFFVIRSYKNAYMSYRTNAEYGNVLCCGHIQHVTKATGKPFSILALKGAVTRCEYVFTTVKISLQSVPFLLIINL